MSSNSIGPKIKGTGDFHPTTDNEQPPKKPNLSGKVVTYLKHNFGLIQDVKENNVQEKLQTARIFVNNRYESLKNDHNISVVKENLQDLKKMKKGISHIKGNRFLNTFASILGKKENKEELQIKKELFQLENSLNKQIKNLEKTIKETAKQQKRFNNYQAIFQKYLKNSDFNLLQVKKISNSPIFQKIVTNSNEALKQGRNSVDVLLEARSLVEKDLLNILNESKIDLGADTSSAIALAMMSHIKLSAADLSKLENLNKLKNHYETKYYKEAIKNGSSEDDAQDEADQKAGKVHLQLTRFTDAISFVIGFDPVNEEKEALKKNKKVLRSAKKEVKPFQSGQANLIKSLSGKKTDANELFMQSAAQNSFLTKLIETADENIERGHDPYHELDHILKTAIDNPKKFSKNSLSKEEQDALAIVALANLNWGVNGVLSLKAHEKSIRKMALSEENAQSRELNDPKFNRINKAYNFLFHYGPVEQEKKFLKTDSKQMEAFQVEALSIESGQQKLLKNLKETKETVEMQEADKNLFLKDLIREANENIAQGHDPYDELDHLIRKVGSNPTKFSKEMIGADDLLTISIVAFAYLNWGESGVLSIHAHENDLTNREVNTGEQAYQMATIQIITTVVQNYTASPT